MRRIHEAVRARLPVLFGIDLRTLALFRVMLAGITALDLLCRLAGVRAFYGDSGVMPRAWLAQTGESWRLSLHLAGGEDGFAFALIAAQALLALMVLAGYRTRAATVLTFMLLGSLHSRNPMILTGCDELLMSLWFWAMFLPIHARWSVDAALSTRPPPESSRHLSWASAALVLQALHTAGLLLGSGPGHFPWVSLASLTVLLRGGFWDWAARRADHGRHLKIYYDEPCGFCLKSCRLLRHFLALPRTEILPAQGSTRAQALMQAQDSWVVIDGEDVAHTKWAAWVALLRHSPLFGWSWGLAKLRLWERPGNAVYDFVARHRGAFGALTSWLLRERAVIFESGRGAQRFAAFMLWFVLAWNLAAVGVLPAAVATAGTPLIRLLRLDPPRDLSAPSPSRDDGWWVVPGRREDGAEVDLLRPDEPLSYARPGHASATPEGSIRWRAYRDRLRDNDFAIQREEYARFLCRDWNGRAAPGQQVLSLKVVYMLPRGEAPSAEQRVVWRHDCVPGQPSLD
ncbi:MAG: DCC1-like thiol-disulfide oxidoreductase family protein [Gammaproteobacteria bacterium]